VSDLAEIHYECAKSLIKNNKSQIFNCGYGVGFSVKEVIKSLNEILKFKILTDIGKRRPGDVKKIIANTNKFYKYFFWRPKYNSLKLIIKSSLAWEKKLKTFYR
jgi:UDP-glucose 4-epimerase